VGEVPLFGFAPLIVIKQFVISNLTPPFQTFKSLHGTELDDIFRVLVRCFVSVTALRRLQIREVSLKVENDKTREGRSAYRKANTCRIDMR
jgi:hypothetical protein